tara:strand:- start:547 stop:921 length:375 start_codon:yes stop_codon:yes gene_type:complete
MKVKGIIKVIETPEEGISKGGTKWKRVGFLIDSGTEYNPLYYFYMLGEVRVDTFLSSVEIGSEVEISYNIKTSEWQGRYYTKLEAWAFDCNSEGAKNFLIVDGDVFELSIELGDIEEEDNGLPF